MDLGRDKKIVVGMSGGIDSSVSLILLKKQGWNPIGVTLKLPIWENKINACRHNICCTPESIKIAKIICKKLQVPYFIADAQKEFKKEVINYFLKELKKYHTPNPCIICNRNLKFQLLIKLANKMKIHYVATGHYAKVKFNKKTDLYELLKGKDKNKDQSYSLSFLTQGQLKHIILPLGNYTKAEVYKIAKKEGFSFFEKIKQSQNFCFVSNKSLPLFIKEEIGENPGPLMDMKGKILGKHQGLYFYTIGQRKGIKLSGGPYFVAGWDKKKNNLLITKNKKTLFKKELSVYPYHLISGKKITRPINAQVRTRYQQKLSQACLIPEKRKLRIILKKNIFAPCPGQFAVFYQKDECLGGGKII